MSKVAEKNSTVLKPRKDIVDDAAKKFRQKLKGLVSKGVTDLTVDLRNIKKLDAIAIAALVMAQNSVSSCDGKVKVCNVPDDINDFFKATKLDQHFVVADK